MGYPSWSVRVLEESLNLTLASDEYLRWAYGQATSELANSYATGMLVIRRAALTMRERIEAEAEARGGLGLPTGGWRWA